MTNSLSSSIERKGDGVSQMFLSFSDVSQFLRLNEEYKQPSLALKSMLEAGKGNVGKQQTAHRSGKRFPSAGLRKLVCSIHTCSAWLKKIGHLGFSIQ